MRHGLPFVRHAPTWLVNGAATVGGIGYLTRAPGTLGSAAGAGFYGLVLLPMTPGWQAALTCAVLLLAWLFCDEAEIRMNARDPGRIVLDEFAAMPLVFLGVDPLLTETRLPVMLFAGFAIFRFYDILKPLGIRRLQTLPGGLGVLVDDLAAGLASCATLHLLICLAQMNAWY